MDWDSDPELKAMRASFLVSFLERKQKLMECAENLSQATEAAEMTSWIEQSRFIAHKLAGSAESYGFPEITVVASALDDWLSHAPISERSDAIRVASYARLLAETLGEAILTQKDPSSFREDPRFRELLDAAQLVRASL
jgi:HPt (histidine-containing phosphotransfer) domain-containing protein